MTSYGGITKKWCQLVEQAQGYLINVNLFCCRKPKGASRKPPSTEVGLSVSLDVRGLNQQENSPIS